MAPMAVGAVDVEEVNLGVRRMMKGPEGSQKEVSVKVTMVAICQEEEEEPDQVEIRHFRTLTMRPEKPALGFKAKSYVEEVDLDEGGIASSYLKAVNNGAPLDIGSEIHRIIRKALNQKKSSLANNEFGVDPNLALEGGGWTTRKWGRYGDALFVLVAIYHEYDWDGKKTKEPVEQTQIYAGRIWQFGRRPYDEKFVPDGMPDKQLQQTLGGGTVQPQGDGRMPFQGLLPQMPPGDVFESRSVSDYMNDILKENGRDRMLKWGLEAGYSLPQLTTSLNNMAYEGTDMNRLYPPELENPCDMDFDAPPGTLWVPTDRAYQSMMSGVVHERHSFLFASLTEMQETNAARVLCMNMNKKEPAKGVKYFPYRPSDPVLPRLAKFMNDSQFRGPWDQARLWIYTDKATIEQVNERLQNGVGEAAYLMALADVNWAGGLDEKMLKDPKYIRPSLLTGAGAPDYAHDFLLGNLQAHHPKKVGEWLRKNSSSMLQLVGSKSDAADQKRFSTTMTRLLSFESPEDREAVLGLLRSASGQLSRLKGQFGAGRVSLYSGRESEVALALGLVESGILAESKDSLAFVAEKGPGEKNRALAKKLLED